MYIVNKSLIKNSLVRSLEILLLQECRKYVSGLNMKCVQAVVAGVAKFSLHAEILFVERF